MKGVQLCRYPELSSNRPAIHWEGNFTVMQQGLGHWAEIQGPNIQGGGGFQYPPYKQQMTGSESGLKLVAHTYRGYRAYCHPVGLICGMCMQWFNWGTFHWRSGSSQVCVWGVRGVYSLLDLFFSEEKVLQGHEFRTEEASSAPFL